MKISAAVSHTIFAGFPTIPAPGAVSVGGDSRARPNAAARVGSTAGNPAARARPLIDLGGQSTAQAPLGEASSAQSGKDKGDGPDGLTEQEREEVEALKQRDREVRAHEQAHKTAGGPYAGQPSFDTKRGPDGRLYAVGGEVRIDTSAVPNNPQATLRKMETVKRAALAPSQPSAQDRQVAAEADAKAQKARQELREQQAEERAERTGQAAPAANGTEPTSTPFSANPANPPSAGPPPRNGTRGSSAGASYLKVAVAGTLDVGTLYNLLA